ncbi:MAG: cytochrome C assembly protein [Acidobacteria bacterium]|nr:cytochrome C assembly protein [Acidobacteriota bacterium]
MMQAIMALTAAGMVATMYGAFLWAPTEVTMGDTQRIFYIHMACWAVAFPAYFVVSFTGIAYLITSNMKWDRIGLACAEIGTLFCTGGLITGPLWAKPAWGVWWTWDMRLTLSLIVWLIYLSYLLLRDFIEEPVKRAKFAAIYGIFAIPAVIFDYMAIRLWRTQHPQPVIMGGPGSGLDPTMRMVLLISTVTFVLWFILLATLRVRLEKQREEVRQLRRELMMGA